MSVPQYHCAIITYPSANPNRGYDYEASRTKTDTHSWIRLCHTQLLFRHDLHSREAVPLWYCGTTERIWADCPGPLTGNSKALPNAIIDKYVVMPNHIHAIIILRELPGEMGKSLPIMMAQYKSVVSKRLSQSLQGRKIWQKSYYDRVIRNEEGYQQAWRYIDENPLRWYLNRGLPIPNSPERW